MTGVIRLMEVGTGTSEPVAVERVVRSAETVGRNCLEDGASVEETISVVAAVGESLISE